MKLKECEKNDKYLDLARELKKLWNMKVTIVPIVIGAFGIITKRIIKGPGVLERWRTSGDNRDMNIPIIYSDNRYMDIPIIYSDNRDMDIPMIYSDNRDTDIQTKHYTSENSEQ